jgi:peroxiredoxin Q/BCP
MPHKKQAKFKEKYFPFPLLADEDRSVIEAFGVRDLKVYGKI